MDFASILELLLTESDEYVNQDPKICFVQFQPPHPPHLKEHFVCEVVCVHEEEM